MLKLHGDDGNDEGKHKEESLDYDPFNGAKISIFGMKGMKPKFEN